MNDRLIVDNNTNDEDQLMKEIKKMFYLKIFKLLICIIRFFLMFFLLFLIVYFPASFSPSYINIFVNIFFFLHLLLIAPILTIYFLIVIITGIINRDFWIKIKPLKMNCHTFFCCCCIMSKNITFLKTLSLIDTIIISLWSFYFLFLIIKDFSFPKNFIFFPYSSRRVHIRSILNFIDSLLLLCQWFCLFSTESFLKKVNVHLEYYKRLIIKNRNKEAEFVRNNLPARLDDYLPSNDGTELQNV